MSSDYVIILTVGAGALAAASACCGGTASALGFVRGLRHQLTLSFFLQGLSPWLPLPPVAAAPPQVTGRTPRRPPPALGAAGSPSAQVQPCIMHIIRRKPEDPVLPYLLILKMRNLPVEWITATVDWLSGSASAQV